MTTPIAGNGSTLDGKSDYGSDFDLQSLATLSDYGSEIDPDDLDETTLVGDLLTQLAAAAATAPKAAACSGVDVAESAEHGNVAIHRSPTAVRFANATMQSSPARAARGASVEFEYDSRSRQSTEPPGDEATSAPAEANTLNATTDSNEKPPLERFRTKPRKPLSVTDLVSPAWCELQYFYTLSKFGRKMRTKAMRTGSKIHRTLEEEVHKIVPVQVKSKVDGFGLRLWNTIQGLRTLRETGMTRELEIWGVLEGQVIIGIIDELSYTSPDPEYEEQLEQTRTRATGGTLPLGQLGIKQAFANAAASESNSASAWVGSLTPDHTVYLSDVKTRGVRSIPTGVSLRPTWMQLMLYRKLLESLSLNTVDAETVFARYDLEPLEPFSEGFMQEIGSSRYNVADSDEVSQHPNLLALWSLMMTEFRASVGTISDVLRAEFRFSRTGDLIGSKLNSYDPSIVDAYVQSEMSWWKGSREAKGVDIEEAFKCRICDFAEDCTWRKTKVEEATEKYRLRSGKRRKSAV
ncbi:hypothetical protein BS50DRAFT_557192 [Corynespora cassiicola Philippines]|uniref:Exonuclease V n=1 Tax=Corynespora cassiicola Philippines TaxID=1448308 RepID=A0A2T2NHR7_CORCC|nr:hypothetical protein BS50DRAFT_557192 [Corynespora cassiicola Philippines]